MTAESEKVKSGASPAFEWTCLRSGRCCTVGGGDGTVTRGIVRVQEDEIQALAQSAGMTEEAFCAHHLRTVPDPVDGQLILSLREQPVSGACTLLEGSNQCTVYEARPEHCRTFPYWKGILNDPADLERARAVCPGIRMIPSAEQKAAAFEELQELYGRVAKWVESSRVVCLSRGVCCHFEDAGHELMAGSLEADYCVEKNPKTSVPAAPGRCPYHVEGKCTAREGRPLGCRTYFCHAGYAEALEAGHEKFLGEIRDIEKRHGYSSSYARFVELLEARVSFGEQKDGA